MASWIPWTVPVVLSLLSTGCPARPPALFPAKSSPCSVDDLSWMSGCWEGRQRGTRSIECWLRPRGRMMVGMHRDVSRAGRTFFEYLRIETRGRQTLYLASPRGRPPTPFLLTRCQGREAVFSNPDHDFPQRISYRLDAAGRLLARIGGPRVRKGERRWVKREWVWRPTSLRPR